MDSRLASLLADQDGVLARRQLLTAGLGDNDIRRLVRRRELAVVHPGVYVDHTGPLTWQQRAWAAVLYAWPAALSHDSAVRACDGPGRRDREPSAPIHVAVARDRTCAVPPDVVLHRLSRFDECVLWNLGPPRVRMEEAVVDLAAEAADDFAAVAVLANAVQARRTTAPRLRAALAGRSRVGRRSFLDGVLRDVADGTCSVLEHAYLTRVERPHGLPRARRQRPSASMRPAYRDVEYEPYDLIVELDGRLFHSSATARDRDLDRDLDAAVDGRDTVRLGWGQVVGRPCATAPRIGQLLRARGWAGTPTACDDCNRGGSQSSSDCNQPRSA